MFMESNCSHTMNAFRVILFLLVSCRLFVFLPQAFAAEEVVVYTSVDQIFSEPILDLFEKQSGITVKAVYDVEASKTVGLVNRLLAERRRPRADVFWNSEIVRTIILQDRDVLTPYFSKYRQDIPEQFKDRNGYWTGFACRSRVLVYNTRLLAPSELPRSLFELADPRWRSKVALANPMFGTTATHMGALYSVLGKEKTEQFLLALKENNVLLVAGNSQVRTVVAAGEVPLGLTDTDDVMVALSQKKDVGMVYLDQDQLGTFVIPNTVSLIREGPNPETGKKLIDFLLSPEVEFLLAQSQSANMPVREDVGRPETVPYLSLLKIMRVDYHNAATMLKESDQFCRHLFSY